MTPVYSVLFALICTILFLIKAMVLRYSYDNLGLDSVPLITNGFMIAGFICLITIIVDSVINGTDTEILRDGLLAGIFECLGNIFIGHALVTGIAGPASALANFQVIVQVVLDIIFLAQYPNLLQTLA